MRAPVFYLAYALIAVNCSADDPPRTLTTNQSTREQPITAHGNSTVTATVSATGAGTIDIPIWVPPGIGNLKPEVGLHYDSHGGNGFLGAGWALSGLSGITRCSGTVATNGAVLPVAHTANDRFCLDGKQLSLVAGTYGQHGSVYRTERDTFARITAHSEASTPGGPRTFIVESKNGLTYRYEAIGGKFVAFATIQPVPRDPVPVEEWVLAEVADRAGNRVRYSYEYANNLPALTKIEYPLVANSDTPLYTIDFDREARPDTIDGFRSGVRKIIDTRYAAIRVADATGTVLRTTNLIYNPGSTSGHSLLTAVQECAAGACRAPTRIEYAPGTAGYDMANPITTPMVQVGYSPALTGDFNGDGRTDLLARTAVFPNLDPSWFTDKWWVQFAEGNGFSAPVSLPLLTPDLEPFSAAFVSSFTAKARAQIVMLARTDFSKPYTTHIVEYVPETASFRYQDTGIANTPVNAVDWDGDGRNDLVFGGFQLAPPYARAALALNQSTPNGLAWGPVIQLLPEGFPDVDSTSTLAANFDGDSRRDLIIRWFRQSEPDRVYTTILLSGGVVNGRPVVKQTINLGVTEPMIVGDWNGDGCSDLHYRGSTTIEQSDCAGGFTPVTIANGWPRGEGQAFFVDYDGDGLDDLFVRDNASRIQLSRAPVRSCPTCSWANPGAIVELPAGSLSMLSHVFPIDFDGDGQQDLVGANTVSPPRGATNHWYVFRRHNGVAPADTATAVSDGLGNTHRFHYRPLSALTAARYRNDAPVTYPGHELSGPWYVVTEQEVPNGSGPPYLLQHSYANGRLDVSGRGFAGFAEHSIIDTRTGIKSINRYSQTFPTIGMVTERLTLDANGQLIGEHETVSALAVKLAQGPTGERWTSGYARVRVRDKYETGDAKHGALLSREETTIDVDDFGNTNLEQRTLTDMDVQAPASPFAGQSWTTTVTSTVANDEGTWCLGMTEHSETVATSPTAPALTRTKEAHYDRTMCRLLETIDEPTQPALQSRTIFTYDNCGNTQSVTVLGFDPDANPLPPRTTVKDFGTRCQFAEHITNALGQTDTVEYNLAFGTPTRTTDANQVTSESHADAFGLLQREVLADGVTNSYELFTCATEGCLPVPNARQRTTKTVTDTQGATIGREEVYADSLGRELQKTSAMIGGQSATIKSTYDPRGCLIRRTRPTTEADNGATDFECDLAMRPIRAARYRADGGLDRQERIRHLGLRTETIDSYGNVTSTQKDVLGHVREVIEPAPGKTARYEYDSLGNLSQFTDPEGAVSHFESNILGLVTKVISPDSGQSTYTFNSLGEKVTATNANDEQTIFKYDALGRLIERTEPEGTSTWQYGVDPTQHNIGRLTKVSGPGYSEATRYDVIGRRSNVQITINGTPNPFEYDYTYSAQGLLDTLTYPATDGITPRLRLKHHYEMGQLKRIADATLPYERNLWTLLSTDAAGHVTEEMTHGNVPLAVATTHSPTHGNTLALQAVALRPTSADAITQLAQGSIRDAGGNYIVPPQTISQLAWDWDANGNLNYRRDDARGLFEQFTYDPLNRLQTATLNGTPNLRVEYNAAGNIMWRSDVGSYFYNDRPHAVSSAGMNHYAYDQAGNMTMRSGIPQTFTSYGLPSMLRAATASSEFRYAPDRSRVRQIDSTGEDSTVAGALFEAVRTPSRVFWRHIIQTPGSVWLTLESDGGPGRMQTMLTDHLGSMHKVYSNDLGQVLRETSFDAFGKRRNPLTWTPEPNSNPLMRTGLEHQGFAGHMQLDAVGMVHMNGRVYDPEIGRFLSHDKLVDISRPQTLNGYSYVENNALSATDPSGWYNAEGADSFGDGNPLDFNYEFTDLGLFLNAFDMAASFDPFGSNGATDGAVFDDFYVDPMGNVYGPSWIGNRGAALTSGFLWGLSFMLPIDREGIEPAPDVKARFSGYLLAGYGMGLATGAGAWSLLPMPAMGPGVLLASRFSTAAATKYVFSNEQLTWNTKLERYWFTADVTANGRTYSMTADGFVDGARLSLRNVDFWDANGLVGKAASGGESGMSEMLTVLNSALRFASNNGFKELNIQFERAGANHGGTTLNPGRVFDRTYNTETGELVRSSSTNAVGRTSWGVLD